MDALIHNREFHIIFRYRLIFVFCIFFTQLIFVSGCDRSQEKDQAGRTDSPASFEQKICRRIDISLKSKKSEETRAILNGLKWCVEFTANEERFDYIFSDYVQMLAELAQNRTDPDIESFATRLIKHAMERAQYRFSSIFPLTPAGKWDFISIIPALCKFNIDKKLFFDYFTFNFELVRHDPYDLTFEQAVVAHDCDLLGDVLIDYSYLDNVHLQCGKPDYNLPENDFSARIQKVIHLPFRYSFGSGEDDYSDQNYYITHLVFVMTHYGDTPLENGEFPAFKHRILNYLLGHFHTIRYQVDDLDLLAEFAQCLKMYGKENIPMVKEAVRYLLSKQLKDGSWQDPDENYEDPYDEFHPTWAVMSALSYSYRAQ